MSNQKGVGKFHDTVAKSKMVERPVDSRREQEQERVKKSPSKITLMPEACIHTLDFIHLRAVKAERGET